jgi:ATP-dependent DNA helicase RecQ
LIDKKAYNTIIQAAQEIQAGKKDPLKPLFELLNEQFDYGQIRLAMAIWEEER